uniref:Uncharacterized protein MANES_02G075700 n=1 Tax=Rhizophora mucronata TaxID=61149 RepID=A0A2P2L138_RHIMU
MLFSLCFPFVRRQKGCILSQCFNTTVISSSSETHGVSLYLSCF